MIEIRPRQGIDSAIPVPGSKSITHRALIASALADGESEIEGALACEDTLLTIGALRELGIEIGIDGRVIRVSGKGGNFSPAPGPREIFLGNSGTSYRFLLSATALARGDYLLSGTPRMCERPIGELVRALNQLGADARCIDRTGFPPVWVRARGLRGGPVTISGDKSSQFLSSLLLTAPYAETDVDIEINGRLVSLPYVDVTVDVMGGFGIPVHRDDYRHFHIRAGKRYRPCHFRIEGDVSSASYFWAAAAVTRGVVTTLNIHPRTTRQGDIGFLEVLGEMGCRIIRESDMVRVEGQGLRAIEADMGSMPDMVPTLAAVALFARGKTFIRNVAHLRFKESDRLRAIALEWQRLGAKIQELSDGLVIQGETPLAGTALNPHNDHRLAMSMAVIGLKVPGIHVDNEHCVGKSFARFWEIWDSL